MKFVFVGGVNRSGTTFLQKLLLLHPKVEGGPEFDFLPSLMRTYRQMKSEHQLDRQSYFYSPDELRNNWQEFVSNLLEDNNYKKGNEKEQIAEYFSEKTPDNIFVADTLLELFPSSRFIYIYRDGRAVLNSLMQVKQRYEERGEQPPYDIRFLPACREWINGQKRFASIRKDFSGHRVYSIQYEKLLSQPKVEIDAMMDFLGLSHHPGQLKPGRHSSHDMQSYVDDRWYTEEMYRQSFNTENIDKWKRELSWFDRFAASVLMGEHLQHYGYHVTESQLMAHRFLKQVRKWGQNVSNLITD